MTPNDIIEITILFITLFIVVIALISHSIKSEDCEKCPVKGRGFCVNCTEYPSNRRIFYAMKYIFKKHNK